MPTFPVSPDLAEVLGVLLGDGCVFRTLTDHGYAYGVSFTGNLHELGYYKGFVKPVLEKSFGVHGSIQLRGDNTVRFRVYSKYLVIALVELGIPLGKRRDAKIPESIKANGMITSFIRGLYHAEGSIYHRYSKKYNRHSRVYDNLLVIQIRMKLKTLMTQLADELSMLGIATNRLTERDGVFTLRVTNQIEIMKFMECIGPRYKTAPVSKPFSFVAEPPGRGPVAQPG